jgi:hypothetical protein
MFTHWAIVYVLWAVFLKIPEAAQIFVSAFFTAKVTHVLFCRKMGWATFWAFFSTNSSGHTDANSGPFSRHFFTLFR